MTDNYPKAGRGWAWAIKNERGQWVLCHWAQPYPACLLGHEKPSPEAKRVAVDLVPRKRK